MCRQLYESELQQRADREWLRARCNEPAFFARMLRTHSDLCPEAMRAVNREVGLLTGSFGLAVFILLTCYDKQPAAWVAFHGCMRDMWRPCDLPWRTCAAGTVIAVVLGTASLIPTWLTHMRRREILERLPSRGACRV